LAYVFRQPRRLWLNRNHYLAVSATVAAPAGINASAAQTLANFTQSAAAVIKVSAAATQTLADFTQTATGTLKLSASASQTLANFTQSATATVKVSAAAAQTLANFTQSASAVVKVNATASQTLADFTQIATGVLAGAGINASAAQTLDNFTQAATAVLVPLPLQASADLHLVNFTLLARASLGAAPIIKTATKPEGHDSRLLTRVKEAFGPIITRPGPGWDRFLLGVNPRAIDERIPPYKQLVSQTYRDIELTHDDDDNVVVVFKLGDGFDYLATVPPDFPGFNKDYLAGLY
jgi:hypothetical protein